MGEILTLELYVENGLYKAHIGEECASGYVCSGVTPEECAEEVKKYIINSFV